MQVRLVHQELQKCYKAEGVNHYQVCAPIVQVYKDLLKEAQVRTPISPQVKGYRTVDVE